MQMMLTASILVFILLKLRGGPTVYVTENWVSNFIEFIKEFLIDAQIMKKKLKSFMVKMVLSPFYAVNFSES